MAKKNEYKDRIPIRGIVRCESDRDCEGFSKYRDYVCDQCYDMDRKSKNKNDD